MTKGNGVDKAVDEGLMALRESFKDAKFLDSDAKDAADLICLGAHREQGIPDSTVMEVFGIITEGKNCQLSLKTKEGHGYVAHIESYANLVAFVSGSLEAHILEKGDEI